LGKRIFGISSLANDEERAEAYELVQSFDENDGVSSVKFFYFSAAAFVLLIALFATTSELPVLKDLGLGFVALSFGLMSLWAYKHEIGQFYAGLDWDLIWFFMTLFAVINTMEHAGVLQLIGNGIESVINLGEYLGSGGLLWASATASSVTDNIPLAAVLAKILAARQPALTPDSSLWWCVIFGANLGGNLTPIGSASTVVAVTLMQRNELAVGFVKFIKISFPFAILQLLLATGYVLAAL
jgi:Na+/H+ antiporter NhaD/arsenite permease-like protein